MSTLIETPRLVMRPFTIEDAEAVYEFSTHPEVTRYTGDAGTISTLEDAQNVIHDTWLSEYEKYGYARYALIHKRDNKVIGFCGFKYLPEFSAPDIGYRMLPQYWGQGLGMEAAEAVMQHGTNTLKLEHIMGLVDVDNTASSHILEALGFHYLNTEEKWGHQLKHYVYP